MSESHPSPQRETAFDQALQYILDQIDPPSKTETVAIEDALGRISAQPIYALRDSPSFISSAMDGYALQQAAFDTYQQGFHLIGKSLAGHPFLGPVAANQCVRITTGAALPSGTDSVVIQENASVRDGLVQFTGECKAGQFARALGSDYKCNSKLLDAGTQLQPAHIALLSAQNILNVVVYCRPTVAILSSGDELLGPQQALAYGKIYDTNRALLGAFLSQMQIPVQDFSMVADDGDSLRAVLDKAATTADIIISSGGVSVGESDVIAKVVRQVDQTALWKVAIKPGKPLIFGHYGQALIFGLPGNPVSVCVSFGQIVLPAIRKYMGMPYKKPLQLQATATTDFYKQSNRIEFQRGLLDQDQDKFLVSSTGDQSSHRLDSISRANCYVILPPECTGVKAGESVFVQPIVNGLPI